MGLIAPEGTGGTCPPLHSYPAIDAMQVDVVGFAADGITVVVREVASLTKRSVFSDKNLSNTKMKLAHQALTNYAYHRMYTNTCPMVEKWWYRESGGKVVDITDAMRKLRVSIG